MNNLQLSDETKENTFNIDRSKNRELPLELQIILYLQMLGFIRAHKNFRYLFEAITCALDGVDIDKNLWERLAKQNKIRPDTFRNAIGSAMKGARKRQIERWNEWFGTDILSFSPRDKYFVEASVDWLLSHKIVDKVEDDKFIGYEILLNL